jgi:hypothetical protein
MRDAREFTILIFASVVFGVALGWALIALPGLLTPLVK